MSTSKEVGKLGEQIATQFLRSKGYAIIACNFWTRLGEIDIIASIDNTIVFVEVKARTNGTFGEPFHAVGRAKFQKWMRACQLYCVSHPIGDKLLRLDVLSIVLSFDTRRAQVKHFENVSPYFV